MIAIDRTRLHVSIGRLTGVLVLAGACGDAGDVTRLSSPSTGVPAPAAPNGGSAPPGGATPPGGSAGRDAAVGCLGTRRSALSVVDRSLVGGAAAYSPDRTLPDREGALATSQRERRRVAWQIAARVLRGVPLSTHASKLEGATLPAWQTWHARDDLTRLFRRLYPELSVAQRRERARFSSGAIEDAWEWNIGAVRELEAWSAERLLSYQNAVASAAEVAGLGGIYRVTYSPAASRHLLESYPEVLGCAATEAPNATAPALAAEADPSHPSCDTQRTAPSCLASEFPDAAVLVKASWQRADLKIPMPVFDTSDAGLARRLSSAHRFSWGLEDAQADPTSDAIYTLRLPNGNAFRLAGLHIMSKELEQWFWITLWWSPDANRDFGADRPRDLPAPFDNYKLCTVMTFTEGDPDPGGGFDADLPSLAGALRATYAGVGGPTWCSNPYIEAGDGNAATNCIGCHQHAGTALRSEDILANAMAFPEFGRTELLTEFPSDYVFAVNQGDDLGAMFQETEDHFSSAD